MERTHFPVPKKSSSFSSTASASSREEKLRESDRTLSLGSLRFQPISEADAADENGGEEEREGKVLDTSSAEKKLQEGDDPSEASSGGDFSRQSDLMSLSEDVDQFLVMLRGLGNSPEEAPEIPDAAIVRFIGLVENEITRYESDGERWSTDGCDDPSFLDSVDRASKLTAALAPFSGEPQYYQAMNHTGSVVHHAMEFLEEEFHSILLDVYSTRSTKTEAPPSSKMKRRPSFNRGNEPDRCYIQPNTDTPKKDSPSAAAEHSVPYPEQSIARLRSIASAMIASGYENECCQVFLIARRNAVEASLADHGFEKISIDDVLRMPWESLESEIVSWIKAFRRAIAIFSRERELCEAVFDGPRGPTADGLFRNLARCILNQLLNFAGAVAMTKRSPEKLFKVLDIYEALLDMISKFDQIFPTDADSDSDELKMELFSARTRLGEAAVSLFCALEISIKSDTAKAPVPGGAVHPLTRYVMNYLKYACEYKNTLEQVFTEHRKTDRSVSPYRGEDAGRDGSPSAGSSGRSPFAAQVVEVMDLLNVNLEAKAKLYKDLALGSIFMMNNGRYIVQKIKGSAEIKELIGETWCRKKSSNLRQYHKNYQRETWSRVLGCFRDEGLQVKGSVLKPVLKERLKIFNAMFDEIHKTQSGWLVSDEQLQSELRVSVSAVVVPAYRSFLGRFGQYLDPGRQTEKYVKFGAEDLESYIDDLFDGNPSSMMKRKS